MKALAGMAVGMMALIATAAGAADPLTTESKVRDLMANPKTAAVLKADIPTIVNNPQLEMGMDLPLSAIAQFEPDALSEANMKKISADLAAAQK